MKTRLIVFIFLLSVGAFASTPTSALTSEEAARKLEAMTWYTEEYPPYNYKGDDGLPTGMSVDILMAAFKKIGVRLTPGDIKIVPWNRSYKFLQKKPKTALFSMTYSPERLAIMKLVGPVVPNNVSVIAPRKKEMGSLTAKDLGQLKLGVVRDDIGDQLLRKFALSNDTIQRKNSLKQLLFLLRTGRVDAVAYSIGVFKHAMKRSGQDPDLYEEVLVLKQGWMGYAFHHSTEPEALVPLQEAIDELHADGTIKKIIARYGD
jgi:polar amino acid transport system substrate-binding protein